MTHDIIISNKSQIIKALFNSVANRQPPRSTSWRCDNHKILKRKMSRIWYSCIFFFFPPRFDVVHASFWKKKKFCSSRHFTMSSSLSLLVSPSSAICGYSTSSSLLSVLSSEPCCHQGPNWIISTGLVRPFWGKLPPLVENSNSKGISYEQQGYQTWTSNDPRTFR